MARRQGKNYYSASDSSGGSADEAGTLHDSDVLQAIASLRADVLARLDHGVSIPESVGAVAPVESVADGLDAPELSNNENEELRRQLAELSEAIAETKQEIMSMRDPKSQSGDEVRAATLELDAVVDSTEVATNSIMEAAEQIDDLASRLCSQLSGSTDAALAEEINERVVNIFEACNFQDITGQRITKVVTTLKFIDERVSKMMELWGAEQVEGDGADRAMTDEDLLNGPSMEGEGASQDDIDALFD
jgi:chemotaxis protein CheZ